MSWPLASLGEHIEILSGYAFKSSQFNSSEDGLPLVRIRDVVKASSQTFYSGKYSEEYLLQNGDMLIGMDGDFNRELWRGGKALLNQRVCKIVANEDSLDRSYLYHFLPGALTKIHAETPAVTVKHLSVKKIRDIKIPLPPLAEQKRIAAILDKADAIRRKRQQAIQLADDFLRSVFLDMFGDPVTNPKGWELSVWHEVLRIVNGRNQKAVEQESGLYPICGSGGYMARANDWLTEANSVIIGRKGNINSPILMRERFWNVDTAFGLEPKLGVLSHNYLYWFCRFFNFERLNKAVTIPSLTKSDLNELKMPLPNYEVQRQFDGIVAATERLLTREKEFSEGLLFEALSNRAFQNAG